MKGMGRGRGAWVVGVGQVGELWMGRSRWYHGGHGGRGVGGQGGSRRSGRSGGGEHGMECGVRGW